jgi:pimeloyl-ACP methyl ester carboxylesterase
LPRPWQDIHEVMPRTRTWAASEVTAAAGTRIHAAVAGPASAPSVVMVHGQGCSHRYFAPLARALAVDTRVTAPDLPGFGCSVGPDPALDIAGLSRALEDWLRATGREGSVLVANSLGCQVVLELAARSPDASGPLVLVAPTTDHERRSWRQQSTRLALDLLTERPGLHPVLLRDALACGPRRFLRTFSAALDHDVVGLLPHVRGPVVVVRGDRDPVVPRRWAREVADRLPDARYVEVPGPHALNWSRPGRLAAVVRDVLAALPSRADREEPVAGTLVP